MTRHREDYNAHREHILADTAVSQTEWTRPSLLSPEHPSMSLKRQILDMARWRRSEGMRGQEPESALARHDLTLGMAEYGNGHFDEALAALEAAQEAFNLICTGAANAFPAMANWQLGQQAEARHRLEAAEAIFRQVMDGSDGDLGSRWNDTAIFQIALTEARSVVR